MSSFFKWSEDDQTQRSTGYPQLGYQYLIGSDMLGKSGIESSELL